jgi:hypothetical protein
VRDNGDADGLASLQLRRNLCWCRVKQ